MSENKPVKWKTILGVILFLVSAFLVGMYINFLFGGFF